MRVYYDSETFPIERARLAPEPVCSQFAIEDGPVNLRLWRDTPIADLLQWVLVGANLSFDLAVALQKHPELAPLIFKALDEARIVDVQLDGKLLDIAAGEYAWRSTRGWNLQELARRVGVRIEKDSDDETGDGSWRLRFKALHGIEICNWPAGAVRYATEEIPATHAVHLEQQAARARWQAQGLDPLGYHSYHASASAFALHLASCYGVYTDPAAVEHVSDRLERALERTGARLKRVRLVRSDGSRDTTAAAAAMVDACGKIGREVQMTEGAEKTEREAIEKWNALDPAMLARAADIVMITEAIDALPTGPQKRDLQARARKELPGTLADKRKLTKLARSWHAGVFLPGVQLDKDCAILSGSRVMELYAEYSGAKLLRGRLDRLRQGYNLPLQTRFDALKETARTSSTQPGDPLVGEQMQNFGRASGVSAAERKRERGYKDRHGVYHKPEFFWGLRECFVPRPGNAFIIADISTAELCTLAQLCLRLFGFSRMAELINSGLDLHIYFAMTSKGLRYEQYDPETMKVERDRAKPGNFGFPGGMGPDKFILYSRKGYGVRFTRPEACASKDAWLHTYPEMPLYLDWIGQQVEAGGGSFTHIHPLTGFVRGGCYYTSGANHGFQHTCAYGAKLGLYRVTRACYAPDSPLYGFRPWNFVHDEVVAEGPAERAPEAAEEMGRIMTETFNEFVPHVPTKAEPLVASRWSKAAKSVREEGSPDGRLLAWNPPPMLQEAA